MPVNKVILLGYVGKDPEVGYMSSGNAYTNISVATPETWKDKNGQKNEKTEWHKVVVFGAPAEACGKYLTKGQQVFVAQDIPF
jgi:single-strand DNA-binding protein